MKKRTCIRLVLLFACLAVILTCSQVIAWAESSVRITKPVNGSTIKPGSVEIWTTFDQPQGDWSGKTLAADYTPVSIRVYKGSTLIDENKITPSGVSFTEKGDRIDAVTLSENGTYTIKVSVPKTSGEWHSVTFNVSDRASSAVEEDDGPAYSSANPGYFIRPEKTSYTAVPEDTVTIKFSMELDLNALGSGNRFTYYSDHVPEGSKSLIGYKALSEYKWVEKDGKYVTDGYVVYDCKKAGTAKLYMYTLVNLTRYDKQVITINIKDPSKSSTTSAAASSVKKDLASVKLLSVKPAKKALTVKWKKLTSAGLKKTKKIEIQYSTDKLFKKAVKTKYASAKTTSVKIKGLKSKKKYYVRIRAYTKSGSVKHISAWSAKKAAKVK